MKECELKKEFWLEEDGLKCWKFTRILVAVQILASSQSEAIPWQTAAGRPGGLQLLAQGQASRGYVSITVKDQHSASAVLASEWTAHCHVWGVTHTHVCFWHQHLLRAPPRQEAKKKHSGWRKRKKERRKQNGLTFQTLEWLLSYFTKCLFALYIIKFFALTFCIWPEADLLSVYERNWYVEIDRINVFQNYYKQKSENYSPVYFHK